jgi:transcription initiation factor TFIIB
MTAIEYFTQCPECNTSLVQDYSKGEYICQRCGYVVMDQVDDYGRESNSTDFEEKAKNTRASGSTSFALHDFGLRTEIAFGTKDYAGKSINSQMAEQMNNIRKWHMRSRIVSPKERRLSNVLTKINEICSIMSLPKLILETAAMLYRTFETKYDAKGKSISCMASATIFLACKKCSVVRSLEEIVNHAGSTDHERSTVKLASKYYRIMVMEMGVFTIQTVSAHPEQTPPFKQMEHMSSVKRNEYDRQHQSAQRTISSGGSSAMMYSTQSMTSAIDQYISKLANMAKIDTKVEWLAIDLAHKTNDHLLADGKAPNGLAAAYIYIAATLLGVNILQRDVSSLSGVTEVTIRNRCKDLLSCFKLGITVKPHIKQHL